LLISNIWVVTQCSVAVGYQRFRGPCCYHLTTRRHNSEDLGLKHHCRESLKTHNFVVNTDFTAISVFLLKSRSNIYQLADSSSKRVIHEVN